MAVNLHGGVGGRVGGKAGRRRRVRKANLVNEINITPFVDVMLVLLIIFMVAAPLLTSGIVVDLPENSSPPLNTPDEPLEVTVKKNGVIFLQDTIISLDEVGPKLLAIAHRRRDTRIFVRGDKNVDYGNVISVVGAINAAGFAKVALITELK